MEKYNQQLELFTSTHIEEYLDYAYQSYIINNPYFQTQTPSSQENFNNESRKFIVWLIEAAEEVNKKRGTSVMFNTVKLT